jgi:hypothetical protein
MNNVKIKKHFFVRLKQRFGDVDINQVLDIKGCSIWTRKNINKCSDLVIRAKVMKDSKNRFMVNNTNLGFRICGNVDLNGTIWINTIYMI